MKIKKKTCRNCGRARHADFSSMSDDELESLLRAMAAAQKRAANRTRGKK